MRKHLIAIFFFGATVHAQQSGIAQQNILRLMSQKEALKIHEHVYQASGFSNTYLITTDAGNIIVDTSTAVFVARHAALLKKVSDAPVKYIILTHGHPDHVGGIARWRSEGTEVVAHEKYNEFRNYQRRLSGLFARRNAAQYGISPSLVRASAEEYLKPNYDATITFRDKHTIELAGVTIELHHAPGESEDQIALWIPQWKIAFIGDNFYETFPNIYTLRGTQTRAPLDWIASVERVLAWEPEILLPSHMSPIVGKGEIKHKLTQYRDAIQYVHDKTVEGMNAGKDVHTLMKEIRLPPELAMSQDYGRLTWSIRGIYEGYVGWFDENPAHMYEIPAADVFGDLVELAGGAGPIVDRAQKKLDDGKPIEALHLIDVVLKSEPNHLAAHELRVAGLRYQLERATNVIERGWLEEGIRYSNAVIKEQKK